MNSIREHLEDFEAALAQLLGLCEAIKGAVSIADPAEHAALSAHADLALHDLETVCERLSAQYAPLTEADL